MKRFSKVLALTIVFVMMMSTIAMAAPAGKVISNVLEATFTVGKSTVAEVSNLKELQDALNDDSITTINIKDDINDISDTIVVDRSVTINGNGNTFSFSELEKDEDGLQIVTDDVTIQNLKVDAGLGDNKENWQGTYAIQVWNATDVTLENVTATGGNGGILVNGSTVTLEGTTDVSDNGFGGIEVSGDTLGDANLQLIVNGTIENSSEKPGKPTIWEDKVNGYVEFKEDEYHSIRVLKNNDEDHPQVHYYLDEKNSQYIELTWEQEPGQTTGSPFQVAVKAEKIVDNVAIPNVLFIVEVEEGAGKVQEVYEIINGDRGQNLGYRDGYWYWGPIDSNGFTFDYNEATTTFEVTADEGEYKVNIYAIQLDVEQ